MVSPLGSSYLSAASAARGSAASSAAKHKLAKYRNDIPGHKEEKHIRAVMRYQSKNRQGDYHQS